MATEPDQYRAWLSTTNDVLINRDGFVEVDVHRVSARGVGESVLTLTLNIKTDNGDDRAIIDVAETALTDAGWAISSDDLDKADMVEGWSPTPTGYAIDVWRSENTEEAQQEDIDGAEIAPDHVMRVIPQGYGYAGMACSCGHRFRNLAVEAVGTATVAAIFAELKAADHVPQ